MKSLSAEMPSTAILLRNILRLFKSYCYQLQRLETLDANANRQGTYHVDLAILGVVGEQVLANEFGLLVEPLNFEYESFFSNALHWTFF